MEELSEGAELIWAAEQILQAAQDAHPDITDVTQEACECINMYVQDQIDDALSSSLILADTPPQKKRPRLLEAVDTKVARMLWHNNKKT